MLDIAVRRALIAKTLQALSKPGSYDFYRSQVGPRDAEDQPEDHPDAAHVGEDAGCILAWAEHFASTQGLTFTSLTHVADRVFGVPGESAFYGAMDFAYDDLRLRGMVPYDRGWTGDRITALVTLRDWLAKQSELASLVKVD